MKRFIYLILILSILTGCKSSISQEQEQVLPEQNVETKQLFQFEVIPETFQLEIKNKNDSTFCVSLPGEKREVKDFVKIDKEASWIYPKEQIKVEIKEQADYLEVNIQSIGKADKEFIWPLVEGEFYQLPLGEGKRIPKTDTVWREYLSENEFPVIEQLSMPFWAVENGESAIVYLLENPYHNTLYFSDNEGIKFELKHEYLEINPIKENKFRIYLTENNPVKVAKTYQKYKIEQGEFKTLAQKEKENKEISKLYGAPYIYLWNERVIAEEDIYWSVLKNSLSSAPMTWIKKQLKETEEGQEALKALEQMENQDYVDNYQKNIICRELSNLMLNKKFYNQQIFPLQDNEMKQLLQKQTKLNELEIIQLNKHALFTNLKAAFAPVEQWTDAQTTDLIEEIKNSGIDKVWIGLNDWTQAFVKPEMVEKAKEEGYLIAPYDSYHSIHKPGEEQWNTAAFEDYSLYENATISNKEGEKITGFQGVGRKLNPTLAFPSVKQRVKKILDTKVQFNSWFIDCDATGEIYDDYTPEHITTQEEDLKARMERIAYIREKEKMVVGSEGGNDFAAEELAFAHGLALQSFSWMDKDMKENKESPYYIGRYYSANGGVPEKFSKPISIKKKYKNLFLDVSYQIPLFQLVYNNSMIVTYHWDWSTLKIKGETENRMLQEFLYQIPPLYHLDKTEWEKNKEIISAHTTKWSEFSKQAIQLEMTDFARLTEDGKVQMTQYGEDLKVVANFSKDNYNYQGTKIIPQSLIIEQKGKIITYCPKG